MSFKQPTAEFIETPVKNSKISVNQSVLRDMNRLNSFTITWFLVKRHKVGLLAVGNIILFLNWLMPDWFTMVVDLLHP